ncbi:MAG TPA: gliding motility-associated C-terminal domain-containing protein [Edaphocola sp.]|nr:gliding motility-associated C-terminal domain-containing protein [Edaphocola sp.]
MIKKILLFLTMLCFVGLAQRASAQLDVPLFSLEHDTICKDSEFTPKLLATAEQSYSWTFCRPLLKEIPEAVDMIDPGLLLNVNNNLVTVNDGEFFYSFTANNLGRLYRYQYVDGIETDPVVTDFGHFQSQLPVTPSGLYVLKSYMGWHVFVIGKSSLGVTQLARVDFGDGLNYPVTGIHTYAVNNILTNPRELFLVMSNDSLRAFTFDNDELKRLDFPSSLSSVINVQNFGTMGGAFDKVSGIAAVQELNNYHFIVSNEGSNSLTHVTFGNSYMNTPFADNLGTFNDKINIPSGISIIKNCNDYYGFVINKNNAQWVVLHWPASIAGTPTIKIHDLGAHLLLPTVVSNPIRDNGKVYLHVVNSSNVMARIEYESCTNASIAGSNQKNPPAVKYNKAGVYSINLVTDQGLSTEKSFCLPITVVEYPSINLTTQDTLICSGDSIRMHALTFGTDSVVWSPNYNIDTLFGNFVTVWPEYSMQYNVTFYFAPNCIVRKDFDIKVDKVVADAGRDRTIVDGAPTVLGGPNTSLTEGYIYEWTPDAYLETTVTKPHATARPPQNMTYYLTVTAPSGCSAIDTVWVSVPCDDIHLPNAFVARQESFGLLNLQLTQVNYFRIYDRWGKEVFSTSDPKVKWNGRDKNGVECELGAYVWEVDAFCKDTNQRFRKSGNVTLLR